MIGSSIDNLVVLCEHIVGLSSISEPSPLRVDYHLYSMSSILYLHLPHHDCIPVPQLPFLSQFSSSSPSMLHSFPCLHVYNTISHSSSPIITPRSQCPFSYAAATSVPTVSLITAICALCLSILRILTSFHPPISPPVDTDCNAIQCPPSHYHTRIASFTGFISPASS